MTREFVRSFKSITLTWKLLHIGAVWERVAISHILSTLIQLALIWFAAVIKFQFIQKPRHHSSWAIYERPVCKRSHFCEHLASDFDNVFCIHVWRVPFRQRASFQIIIHIQTVLFLAVGHRMYWMVFVVLLHYYLLPLRWNRLPFQLTRGKRNQKTLNVPKLYNFKRLIERNFLKDIIMLPTEMIFRALTFHCGHTRVESCFKTSMFNHQVLSCRKCLNDFLIMLLQFRQVD